MKIEDAIQQPTFQHLAEKSMVNLMYTGNCLIYRIEQFLKPYQLTLQQYNILRILRGQKGAGICLQDIKRRMVDRNPDVSRLIERMRQQNWLSRNFDPVNRRKVQILITEEGLKLLAEIDQTVSYTFEPFLGFDDETLQVFNDTLDRIKAAVCVEEVELEYA